MQNQDSPNDENESEDRIDDFPTDLSEKVLVVRTEESILQDANEHIKQFTEVMLEGNQKSDERLREAEEEGIVKDKEEITELQKQVQIGEITPFEAVAKQSTTQKVKGIFDKTSHLLNLEKYLQQQAQLATEKKQVKKTKLLNNEKEHLIPNKKPRLNESVVYVNKKVQKSKQKTFKVKSVVEVQPVTTDIKDLVVNNNWDSNDAENVQLDSSDIIHDSGSEYIPSDDQEDSGNEGKASTSKKKNSLSKFKLTHMRRIVDDGNEQVYKQRMELINQLKHETFHKIDNLFKVPQFIWKNLYRYQRVSVQWLWELHGRDLGGLLGDEMGLGKTVQVIAFLAGLDCSELLSDGGRFRGLGPTLIVCPATLMEQWVKHFHDWYPTLRIVVLHQSGTYDGNAESLINSLKVGGVLVTSYSGVLKHKDLLVASQWHYVILDEGHKIRNPQAKVSKAVKEFSTPHRLLLTGSPMQNSLKELWSLFDFILPGKLGTLPAFLEHCAGPITRGGYANATALQEATALHVATMLKDAITPYMLRRTKTDVKHHVSLPEKNEQVLFCSLTDEQKKLYKKYLSSEDVSFVLHEKSKCQESGRYKARLLVALSALRKICNHPDLFLYTSEMDSDEDIDISEESLEKFGYWKRAGKMTVVRSLLKIWKRQGHRVLLFTQGRQMMHILESLLQQEKYSYLRMDGTTPMGQRQQTISIFNNNSSYFVFLLTTRVGGLGVNLTGANRVVIYDPDWNPATDSQARERAWRIGQSKRVTIYRLITAGTIEEKMYHRQIFKLLLSNRVLDDPRQRKLFRTSDLAELFNLNEPINGESSESDKLFQDSKLTPMTTQFSFDKIQEMRKLASALSKSISGNVRNVTSISEVSSEKSKRCTENVPNENQKDTENTNAETKINNANNNDNSVIKRNEKNDDKRAEVLSAPDPTINNPVNTQISYNDSIDHCQNTSNKNPTDASKSELSVSSQTHRKHKHSKKSSHKEKPNISAIFEGERISCLLGRRLGRSQTEKPTATADDHYVLSKLFYKSKVSSAFQHEAVLLNARENPNEEHPMQRVAREAAEESMDCVRKSRKWCLKPTWDKAFPSDD